MEKIESFDGEYAFLSNFYPSKITCLDEIQYPTVEHAFQAMKTKDISERLMIAAADTPGKAKRLGRCVTLREDWEGCKDDMMYFFVYQKFSNNSHLRLKLIATGDLELVEGNYWHDNYWGNCTCEKCKNIPGKNQLGQTLMRVRKALMLEEEKNST